MKNLKISVIVPVYNVQKYLRKCLKSILNQTYDNLEVILVDDGSTDKSGVICDEYSADNRVIVEHQCNKGLFMARKKGIQLSTGDFVLFVDSDDRLINRESIRIMVENIEKTGADVIQFAYRRNFGVISINSDTVKTNSIVDGDELLNVHCPHLLGAYYETPLTRNVWDKIYNKKLFSKDYFDLDCSIFMGEDAILNMTVLQNVSRYFFCKESLYKYRETSGGTTKTNISRLADHNVLKSFQMSFIDKYKDKYKWKYDMIYWCHVETAYTFRYECICVCNNKSVSREESIKIIRDYLDTEGVKQARNYFDSTIPDTEEEAIKSFIKLDAEDYYDYVRLLPAPGAIVTKISRIKKYLAYVLGVLNKK